MCSGCESKVQSLLDGGLYAGVHAGQPAPNDPGVFQAPESEPGPRAERPAKIFSHKVLASESAFLSRLYDAETGGTGPGT